MQLVIGHRIIRAFEEEYPVGILQILPRRRCDPKALAAVASGGLSLVCHSAVPSRTAPLFEPDHRPVSSRDGEREGEIPEEHTLPPVDILLGEEKVVAESDLRLDV